MTDNSALSTLELLGIASCDTCRSALKALRATERTVDFRDVRADPLSEAEISDLYDQFGEALINRRSTTWRGLSEEARADNPISLLTAHPTLMKRPVIRDGDALHLGWTAEVKGALGV